MSRVAKFFLGMIDEDGASIVEPDATGRWIRTEGLIALSDNQ